MRILVTNDDGINSKGIEILINFAKTLGDVIVCAPKNEQSARSHSIELKKGIEVKKIDLYPEVECYSVDSTPADCLRIAHYCLNIEYDILFSGINNGYNLGDDILYSGTVSAAMESALFGKKAIAFSFLRNNFEGQKSIKLAYNYIVSNGLLEKHNLYNVNIPPLVKGIKMTKQGYTHFDTYFEFRDGLYYQLGEPHFEKEIGKEDSDVLAVIENYISITPLTFDRTKYFK